MSLSDYVANFIKSPHTEKKTIYRRKILQITKWRNFYKILKIFEKTFIEIDTTRKIHLTNRLLLTFLKIYSLRYDTMDYEVWYINFLSMRFIGDWHKILLLILGKLKRIGKLSFALKSWDNHKVFTIRALSQKSTFGWKK